MIQRADKLMYEAKTERASHIYLVRARLENGGIADCLDSDALPVEEDEG